MIDKLVVAPQIVVYRNAFQHNKELIDLLKTDENSIFSPWVDWYNQGYRKQTAYDRTKDLLSISSGRHKRELLYLEEICQSIDFIQKDYFNDFGKNNGVWPPYITDWDRLTSKMDFVYIDYFRYDKDFFNFHNNLDLLLMDYHVDEFPIGYEANLSRDVITINLYLNDEYEGGEICAYDHISNKSYKYKPSPGDMVVMPSTEPFYHAVKGFSGHDRYFLRVFIKYDSVGTVKWQEQYKINKDFVLQQIELEKEQYIKDHMQTIKVFGAEIDVKEMMK